MKICKPCYICYILDTYLVFMRLLSDLQILFRVACLALRQLTPVKVEAQTQQNTTLCMESPYRKIYNIRRTKSQNSNISCFGLQLSLRNILKPGVKWRIKMYLVQRRLYYYIILKWVLY